MTTYRKRNGTSLGTALEIQAASANRRGRRIGTTAISVHQAKNSEPNGTALMTHHATTDVVKALLM